MIPVTRPYFPEINRYLGYIERCYENCQLTNNGPLVQELKARLEDFRDVVHMMIREDLIVCTGQRIQGCTSGANTLVRKVVRIHER